MKPIYWKEKRLQQAVVVFAEYTLDQKRAMESLLDCLYAMTKEAEPPSAAA